VLRAISQHRSDPISQHEGRNTIVPMGSGVPIGFANGPFAARSERSEQQPLVFSPCSPILYITPVQHHPYEAIT